MKMLLFSNKYLTIPIDKELGNSDDRFLLKAMNAVAKINGFKSGRKYLKSKFGCSGNSVKNMTKTRLSIISFYWNLEEYPTKDAYRHIRKIDKDKYAEVIKSIVIEYSKIAPEKERKDLIEYLRKYNIALLTYQKALCYKSLDGLNVVISDSKTANRINGIKNAKKDTEAIAEKILGEFPNDEIEVKL